MAKQRTDKCIYLSRYGGGEEVWITPAQYLSEKMCEKQAAKDNKKLPTKFWQDKEWAKRFVLQANHVSKLLNNYKPEILLEVVKHWRLKNIYSWGLLSVIEPICKEIADRNDKFQVLQEDFIDNSNEHRENVPMFRPSSSKASLINKLRD